MRLLKHVSLRTRIMAANFLMVAIPMLILSVIGGALYLVFYISGPNGIGTLSYLWPERGPAISIEYAISSLKTRIDRKRKLDIDEIYSKARLLEEYGLRVVVLQHDRLIYQSLAERDEEEERSIREISDEKSYIYWDDEKLHFYYRNPNHESEVFVYGRVPFTPVQDHEVTHSAEEWRERIEGVLWAGLLAAALLILLLGYYLASLLSRHIEAMQAERARYEEARKEMIAGISHDLRTPLTLLKGYASGILDGIAATEEQRQKYVERIYRNAKTMERLVEDLFFFSKWELGERHISLQEVSMSDCLLRFLDEEEEGLKERGLDISIAGVCTDDLVYVDEMGLRRILYNILDNSIKYKVRERVAVEVRVACDSSHLRLTIGDDGAGVQDAELSRLFDTFYRVDRARTDVAKGSGIGLAVARRIVEDMHGRIWAEHAKTGGLAIVIELPRIQEKS